MVAVAFGLILRFSETLMCFSTFVFFLSATRVRGLHTRSLHGRVKDGNHALRECRHNVRRVYAVPFAAYKQVIFFRGKRHGTNTIISLSINVSVVNTLVRRSAIIIARVAFSSRWILLMFEVYRNTHRSED